MTKKIAIIGMGHVGKAFAHFIGNRYKQVTYDIAENTPYPKSDIDACDLAVICVPTPEGSDGSCDTSFVEDALARIDTPLIMIKSTVTPGTTERLKAETGKRIVFSPEYIGESTYDNPVYKTMSEIPFHVVGGDPKDVQEVFELLEPISGPYCTYYACAAVEAELIKYMDNCFLATKVAFVNQFYDIAGAFNADWRKVREGWLLDERIGRGHTAVFAEDRGFNGKCLPKDIAALIKAAENCGYDANILKAVAAYNDGLRG